MRLFSILALLGLLGCGVESPAPVAEDSMSADRKAEVTEFWGRFRQAEGELAAGEHAAAATSYERALELRPGHEASLNNLANCYLALGRPGEAVAALLRIVEHDDMSARAHARVGVLLSTPTLGLEPDLDEASRHFERVRALNRVDSAPHLQLGRLKLYRGDLDGAATALRHSLDLNFRGIAAARHLARVHALRGEREEAIAVLTGLIAAELEPRSPRGMTAEGETTADLTQRTLFEEKLLPLLDDLRRLGVAQPDPVAEASRRLEPRWPRWSPPGVDDLERGVLTAIPVAELTARAAGLTVEVDLDGDGVVEKIRAVGMPWPSALAARLADDPLPGSLAVSTRVASQWQDVTAEWFGETPVPRVPVACLAVGDLDGDGRRDLFLGCGSPDPLEIHPDLVLLQTEVGRFEVHRLDLGEGRERGTRRLTADADGWILQRSSAFSGADGPGDGDLRIVLDTTVELMKGNP